jgi:LysM repeat protein
VLLAAIVLAVTLALGTSPTPAPPATFASHLPTTQPGLSSDEGVFLSTTASDGSGINYFVAQNSRHSISQADLLMEEQINPLWPWRTASRAQVMAYPEGSPIGSAAVGLLSGATRAAAAPAQTQDAAAAASTPTVAEEAPTVAEAAPAVAETTADTSYTVQRGDSAIIIARRTGISEQALLEANGIRNANLVMIGQTLTIPGSADAATVAEQAPTVPEQAPAVAEEAPADADAPETTADTIYTVQRGDSAIIIARRTGISEQALLEANGIRNANLVMIGQALIIPAG